MKTETKGNRKIVDWRIGEQCDEDMEIGDGQEYAMEWNIDNQSYVVITDSSGKTALSAFIEINKGRPTLHLSVNDSENLLHIHCLNGKLVLTPSDSCKRFKSAAINRYSYESQNALEINHED